MTVKCAALIWFDIWAGGISNCTVALRTALSQHVCLLKWWLDHSQKNLCSTLSRLGSRKEAVASQTRCPLHWLILPVVDQFILRDIYQTSCVDQRPLQIGIPFCFLSVGALWELQSLRRRFIMNNRFASQMKYPFSRVCLLPKRANVQHKFFWEWSSQP